MPAQLGNRLLASLPAIDLQRISPHLKQVSLQRDQVIYDALAPIEYVYFPISCALSALHLMSDGSAVEVGSIGNEGVGGASVLSGSPITVNRVITQIPGDCVRIDAGTLTRAASDDGSLRKRLADYQNYFLAQVCQSVACNAFHPIRQRCCRWLLMSHDRIGSDVVPLTHEFLSFMLGVRRRASVTEVLISLQEDGVLRTGRGKVTVINRRGLETLSCECYEDLVKLHARLVI